MIRVLLADDHELMRQGVRNLLELYPEVEICGEAKDGQEAVEKALECLPDVAMLDLSMPKMGGLEATRQIREVLPETEVLILTAHDTNMLVREVLNAGARGYVLKSDNSTQIVDAVKAIAQHNLYFSSGISESVLDLLSKNNEIPETDEPLPDSPLTARETEVVRLLALGKSNKEIASTLYISVRTVETHRRTIFNKLDINSIAMLVRYAIRHRLINA